MPDQNSPPDALLLDMDLRWGGGDGVWARLAEGDKSDEQLAAEVESRLRATRNLVFDHVSVSALDGIVILRGNVATRSLRDVVQTWALSVPGVQGLCNKLDVGGSSDTNERSAM